ALIVDVDDELYAITSSGGVIRTPAEQVRKAGRQTKGVRLMNLGFSVSRSEQRTRFLIRQVDPVRQWKLSANDIESLDRWDAYTQAKVTMIRATDTESAP
ncbi:DNA gyrase C-terminal beta-propeller domain-containing protein, partial [Amycolatopsis magusensis]|uniref:DNA gyrase C-terminal beta-propeller domain-containing protein n=1 Tax=Amycolatopsis magusensis TaxID=882444 RepID=UPI0024A8B21A